MSDYELCPTCKGEGCCSDCGDWGYKERKRQSMEQHIVELGGLRTMALMEEEARLSRRLAINMIDQRLLNARNGSSGLSWVGRFLSR